MSINSYIPEHILKQEGINATDKLVYGIIFGFTSSSADCWITTRSMATALGVSTRTINRSLHQLITSGYITQEFDDGRRYLMAKAHRIEIDPKEQAETNMTSTETNTTQHRDKYDSKAETNTTRTDIYYLRNDNTMKEKATHTTIVNWDKLTKVEKIEIWVREGKRRVKIDGELSNLFMTEAEIRKALEKYKSQAVGDMFPRALAQLDSKSENSQKTFWGYKSHYKALIGWVLSWAKQEKTNDLRLERAEANVGGSKVGQARITRERAETAARQPQKQPDPEPASPEAIKEFKQGVAQIVKNIATSKAMPEEKKNRY